MLNELKKKREGKGGEKRNGREGKGQKKKDENGQIVDAQAALHLPHLFCSQLFTHFARPVL